MGLEPRSGAGHDWQMESSPKAISREERLAAKLRENLRRRKAQARAVEANTLPKQPPKS